MIPQRMSRFEYKQHVRMLNKKKVVAKGPEEPERTKGHTYRRPIDPLTGEKMVGRRYRDFQRGTLDLDSSDSFPALETA